MRSQPNPSGYCGDSSRSAAAISAAAFAAEGRAGAEAEDGPDCPISRRISGPLAN